MDYQSAESHPAPIRPLTRNNMKRITIFVTVGVSVIICERERKKICILDAVGVTNRIFLTTRGKLKVLALPHFQD